MACYAVLALLAGFTLTGNIRNVTLIVLAAFALRTWLVVLKRRED